MFEKICLGVGVLLFSFCLISNLTKTWSSVIKTSVKKIISQIPLMDRFFLKEGFKA